MVHLYRGGCCGSDGAGAMPAIRSGHSTSMLLCATALLASPPRTTLRACLQVVQTFMLNIPEEFVSVGVFVRCTRQYRSGQLVLISAVALPYIT